MLEKQEIGALLNSLFVPEKDIPFLEDDPVQIPHQYSRLQDIEITAFWTAMLAWGQRKTIINKAQELFDRMGDSPYEFILHLDDHSRKICGDFKHRTFNGEDTLYFLDFLHDFYQRHTSLEEAFFPLGNADFHIEDSLCHFHDQFFSLPHAIARTRKHIATPMRKSACKRLCLFLKWMVRKDVQSGDMGVWNRIKPSALILPLDVHVMRSITSLGIVPEKPVTWNLAVEVTDYLKEFDPLDPVKYDYPLFTLSRYHSDYLKRM